MAQGIAHLTHLVEKLQADVGSVQHMLHEMKEKVNAIPTREELDAAKAQLMQVIADATTRVTTDIQALKDQLAAGQPITQQDLDDLTADIGAVGNIDPANPNPPARRR